MGRAIGIYSMLYKYHELNELFWLNQAIPLINHICINLIVAAIIYSMYI